MDIDWTKDPHTPDKGPRGRILRVLQTQVETPMRPKWCYGCPTESTLV